MGKVDKYLPIGLLLISAGLLCWGILGMLEYWIPAAELGLQNKNFPKGLQFLHFFALLLTGAIFVIGYLKHWPYTPFATITMYAVLAAICFIETIDFGAFGGGAAGLSIMVMEFILYVGLSVYLMRSSAIRHHFRSVFHGRRRHSTNRL